MRPRRLAYRGPPGGSVAECKLNAQFRSLVLAAVKLARDRGCENPEVYIEAASGLLIMDGESHSGYDDEARPDRIVVSVGWPQWVTSGEAVVVDVGAW